MLNLDWLHILSYHELSPQYLNPSTFSACVVLSFTISSYEGITGPGRSGAELKTLFMRYLEPHLICGLVAKRRGVWGLKSEADHLKFEPLCCAFSVMYNVLWFLAAYRA